MWTKGHAPAWRGGVSHRASHAARGAHGPASPGWRGPRSTDGSCGGGVGTGHATTGHGATGHQGLICPHHLRPWGLPRHAMACGTVLPHTWPRKRARALVSWWRPRRCSPSLLAPLTVGAPGCKSQSPGGGTPRGHSRRGNLSVCDQRSDGRSPSRRRAVMRRRDAIERTALNARNSRATVRLPAPGAALLSTGPAGADRPE